MVGYLHQSDISIFKLLLSIVFYVYAQTQQEVKAGVQKGM